MPASSLPEGFETRLVNATLDRASRLAERFGADGFDTVYIGGGTPTMLSDSAMDRLLGGLESLAAASTGNRPIEWTVEANPDSLRPETLDSMARRGVTRLSLGVQSLDPTELRLLGRRHGPDEALRALRLAADRGLATSADLIAGIPSSTRTRGAEARLDRLSLFAKELIDAGATHISVYDLTLEKGTPLADAAGGLFFLLEDDAWEQRTRLEGVLRREGLRRYEVSNYAAPGRECRHNLAYWRMNSYLGAGPGAVSTIVRKDGSALRIEEAKQVDGYGDDKLSVSSETGISLREAAFETIMMSFRTSFGIDLDSFKLRFGRPAGDLIGKSLATWSERLLPGEPWPIIRSVADDEGAPYSAGPALDGTALDLLNRFLGDCLEEMDGCALV
jgi:oxygen-independent coproporphyrinogen-3 oxidase